MDLTFWLFIEILLFSVSLSIGIVFFFQEFPFGQEGTNKIFGAVENKLDKDRFSSVIVVLISHWATFYSGVLIAKASDAVIIPHNIAMCLNGIATSIFIMSYTSTFWKKTLDFVWVKTEKVENAGKLKKCINFCIYLICIVNAMFVSCLGKMVFNLSYLVLIIPVLTMALIYIFANADVADKALNGKLYKKWRTWVINFQQYRSYEKIVSNTEERDLLRYKFAKGDVYLLKALELSGRKYSKDELQDQMKILEYKYENNKERQKAVRSVFEYLISRIHS